MPSVITQPKSDLLCINSNPVFVCATDNPQSVQLLVFPSFSRCCYRLKVILFHTDCSNKCCLRAGSVLSEGVNTDSQVALAAY